MSPRSKTATLEFLGSGTSTGVPVLGCNCEVCRSTDPRDKRLRSSVLIRHEHKNVIIDTGPEFRIQCLRAGVKHLDSVLITHDHSDHLHGIDDLRAFSLFKKKTLPVWMNKETMHNVKQRFGYMWKPLQIGGGVPDLVLHEAAKPFQAGGMTITPVPIKHGVIDILGFRFGDVAYMTDISSLPEASLPLVQGVGTMIISCVRYRFHRTHLNIAGVKRLHAMVKPERTILTHLTHYFSHKEISAVMPVDIMPAYDGMTIDVNLQ